MDLSTGSLVEQGMAVGIIAAQSIGEPGTQLTMRTFHIGGTAARAVEESEIRAKKGGIVQFTRMKVVRNDEGQQVVLTRNGEILLLDPKGRELEKYEVPAGANLLVEENQEVQPGAVLCQWDPHSIPILAEVGGKVRYEDVIEGETMRMEKDPGGHVRLIVTEHKGDLHPQVVLEDDSGKILDFYYLPEKANIEVPEGKQISAGTLLAKTPREVSGTQDITGGLPRVTEIFEARKPKDPAVIAEIDGTVEILGEKRRGKRTIIVRSETGIEREHLVSHGKHLRVHSGTFVRAGEALVDGPLVPARHPPHLRRGGRAAVPRPRNPERLPQPARGNQRQAHRDHRRPDAPQGPRRNDRRHHLAARQRDGQVRVPRRQPGAGQVREDHREGRQRLRGRARSFPIDALEQANAQIEALGGTPAKGVKPKSATASTQLLGITKAAVQSSSFISAASFQETTKVLTEAALAGKVDRLVGLKENVILGHLVPAGTGFRTYQQSEVRIRPQALESLAAEKEDVLARHFPLLGRRAAKPAEEAGPAGGRLMRDSRREAESSTATAIGALRRTCSSTTKTPPEETEE